MSDVARSQEKPMSEFTLVRYDAMRTALVQAHCIDEVKEIRDKAAALCQYARQVGESLENQNMIAEIKLRAERRAGELIAEMPMQGPGEYQRSHDVTVAPTLSDMGISRMQSSRWQSIASLPELVFEGHIAEVKAKSGELTTAGILDRAKDYRREEKKQQNQELINTLPPPPLWDEKVVLNTIQVCTIDNLHLPAASIDMIFTDPPYHDEHIHLYGTLARLAQKVLKPGGYLMTYAGKMFLPQIMVDLAQHLEYVNVYAVIQLDSDARILRHNLFDAWRPILAFRKPGRTAVREWVPDAMKQKRDKQFHEWQQGIEPALAYIQSYTKPGDVVLDPFVGGGTTALACRTLGRYYLAFDQSEEAVKISLHRLRNGSFHVVTSVDDAIGVLNRVE